MRATRPRTGLNYVQLQEKFAYTRISGDECVPGLPKRNFAALMPTGLHPWLADVFKFLTVLRFVVENLR